MVWFLEFMQENPRSVRTGDTRGEGIRASSVEWILVPLNGLKNCEGEKLKEGIGALF